MPAVTVTGNDNFLIVAEGDVYLPTAPVAPSTGDDRRNLVNLLGQVRRVWITNVLEHSVSHAALIDPPVRMEPGAVEPPWRRYLEAAGQPAQIVPPGGTVGRAFSDAGRMLLILGEPGAGKTTTLLTLARECIEVAEHDSAAPVPVVLNLSSWTGSRPFHEWLVAELGTGYNVGKPFARRWLNEHRLLLLLDGLDEVGEGRRAACVEALHGFVEEHGVPGLAVCCRSTEYRALPVRLKLGGAVLVVPLEMAQIDAYLDAAGPALDGLRGALDRNAELRRLAASPLMLSIMTLAFRGLCADALRFDETSTHDELRDEIFGRFVDRMFVLRERPEVRFSRERVEGGLRWLASGMRERASIFAVELLQPEWLSPRQLFLYALASRAGGSIAVTVAIGAVICLAAAAASEDLSFVGAVSTLCVTLGAAVAMGLLTGLFYAPLGYHALRQSRGGRRRDPRMVEEIGLFVRYLALSGLAALLVNEIGRWGFDLPIGEPSSISGFFTIAAGALALPVIFARKTGRGSADQDISLAGTLSWQSEKAVELIPVCVICGGGVIVLSPETRLLSAAMAAIAALALVMYSGWRQEVPPVERWRDGDGNSALHDSGRIFAYGGLACVVTVMVLAFVGETAASLPSFFGGAVLVAILVFSPAIFWFGGIDVVLHAMLRLVLFLTGTTPLRLRLFLGYAVHLGFLQRAGGGYIFFHRLLLEHFAAIPAAAGGKATRPPAFPIVGPSA